MIIFFIIIGIIFLVIICLGIFFFWKINHLVTPELIEATMLIYRANTTKAQTVTKAQTLAILTSISSSIKGLDPITVTKAKLNNENITLITIGGTQKRQGQATTMEESKLASKGLSNDYLKAVLKLFENGTIPKDKPILVSGISLGGMIAQQLIDHPIIKNNYPIKAIITFGSPLTMPYNRNGTKVIRFVDSHDIIPKLGEMTIKKKGQRSIINKVQNVERIIETGLHKGGIEAHALSYISDTCWDKYDFLGMNAGSNTLVLEEDMTFYPAPKLSL